MTNEIWTIGRILKWTAGYFQEKGIESPRLDAEVLLAHILKKERIYLYVHFDEPLEQSELAQYREAIKKRVRRVPVAYITGQRDFMGLTFHVTPDVLVPQPDTEILVQAAKERLETAEGPVKFADIGTGSGAICLSLLAELPEATASTVDISPAARAVAEKNARELGVADSIAFYTGDLLAPLDGQEFDAILSNPPYIPDADIPGLAPEVKSQEPMIALAGGRDGLDFYRRLAKDAPPLIKAGGFLAVEVGIHQAASVAKLFEAHPRVTKTSIVKDYAGIDRVVVADII